MNLFDKVEAIRGIGPKTAEILKKSGLFTVRDLFYYLPRAYDSYISAQKISDIRPGKIVIKGKIDDLHLTRTRRRNFTITEGVIRDNSDAIRVVWFNQPYRIHQFDPKKEYYFAGNYEFSYNRFQLTSPSVQLASDIEKKSSEIIPIYPARGNFKSNNFTKIFANLRPEFAKIPDLLPISTFSPPFVKKNSRAEALFKVHFPEKTSETDAARRYLAYEELFELILAANLNKLENQKLRSVPLKFDASLIKNLVEKLPFKLTNAQRLATWEILQDLEKPTPMNRLLQGDVGSGKTVVAAISAFETAKNGFQTALLAPTAILATQHAESLSELLTPFGVKVGLLTGATKKKSTLKKQIKLGEVDLIVGTHALLTDDTEFKSLALCIIDEQHRFGVNQRQKLLTKTTKNPENPEKITSPHLLSMTATPIPRSLQLAIFGDLEVSILNELPKGRQPIETKILSEVNMFDDLYPKITETLNKHQQVYWICKAIDDNPKTETASVKKEVKRLGKIFPTRKIALLHGRMKNDEKDAVMNDFSKGKIDILVSTTVVEVGVNVPNANLMVIMDAENYGLAQLHQLRGRVGRGTEKSFCFLITSGENAPSRRLRELESSTDGFHLAEVDLKLRGPGEIYGSLQHGALDLRIASLTDTKLISLASKHAKEFAKTPENMLKYEELSNNIKKYQQLTTLN